MNKKEKKIFFIRHAESEANVGEKLFRYSDSIRITEHGKKQADELVEILSTDENLSKPDRIILSNFIRTQQTAAPLIKKLTSEEHNHEVHLWLDTHEFDSVCGERINEMDLHSDFLEANESFWKKLDPSYKDSEHVESFSEFIDRMNRVILKLQKLKDGVNFVFTHGWFIKLFLLMTQEFSDFNIRKSEENIYQVIMNRFVEWDSEFKTKNTGIYEVTELVEKYSR